jgi:hypothetical protein
MTVSPMPQKLRPALWHHTASLRWQIAGVIVGIGLIGLSVTV